MEFLIPANYNVARFTINPSVAALVMTATNGDTLVIPEPVAWFNKVNGLVTVQSRRAVNSVTFDPREWDTYSLDY